MAARHRAEPWEWAGLPESTEGRTAEFRQRFRKRLWSLGAGLGALGDQWASSKARGRPGWEFLGAKLGLTLSILIPYSGLRFRPHDPHDDEAC